MTHPKEDQLIAFHDGERESRESIADHLISCAECRAELNKIEAVFAAMDAVPVPDPGENYGQRVWAQIAPRLDETQPRWWEGFLAPRRLVAVGALAAVVILAFVAGRWTTLHPPTQEAASADKVRERVLVVAVGQHLGKSEMVLMEFENAQPVQTGQKLVNISAEQHRAEELLDENRLYRETALQSGDKVMASTLDELERTLLDIANSPEEVTPARFEVMRKRIESQGILFKVRVVHQDLRERQKPAKPSPEKNDSTRKARNKV